VLLVERKQGREDRVPAVVVAGDHPILIKLLVQAALEHFLDEVIVRLTVGHSYCEPIDVEKEDVPMQRQYHQILGQLDDLFGSNVGCARRVSRFERVIGSPWP